MKEIVIPSDALARFRDAASQFAGSAKSRVSRLEAVRDDIAAMRTKGASFRTISELLSRCGIRASDTCVMRFCQRSLGEATARGRDAAHRSVSHKNTRSAANSALAPRAPASPPSLPVVTEEAKVALLDDLLSCSPPAPTKRPAEGGPRIAKIKFAEPTDL